VAGEYLVASIRSVYARAGRRISIIGHSQGGMVPRWALRFWPDTRSMVDDLIGIAPSNNGSVLPHATCATGCSPADAQQASGSNFLRALNSRRETFPGISYSVILSRFDEEDIPAGTLPSDGGQVTNSEVQDVCPLDHTEHLGLGTYDPVAYALAIDALSHPGPAVEADIPSSVCLAQFMPGVNPATFPTDATRAAVEDETSASPTVFSEPPLACYVMLACPAGRSGRSGTTTGGGSGSGGKGGCAREPSRSFVLHATAGARVVRARLYVDGRLVLSRRGLRLRLLLLPARVRGRHTVRIQTMDSSGRRRISVRHYVSCSKTRPKTREVRTRRQRGRSPGRGSRRVQ